MTFAEKLRAARERNRSVVCVGLDPDVSRLPAGLGTDGDGVFTFLREIIDATVDLVCAFKPNLAFYEAIGDDGLVLLGRLIRHIDGRVPVIADAKRGDIATTAEAYAVALYDRLGADATTASPFLGFDSVEPFLRRRDRGCFLLCRTSNPGARDFQDLIVDGKPLYLRIAQTVSAWNQETGNCGLVVGATYPEEMSGIRDEAPSLPILIPAVGAQGGSAAIAAEASRARTSPVVISASRSVLYASSSFDFADAARKAVLVLRAEISL